MGEYLSKPVKTKETLDDTTAKYFDFAASSMQGWRLEQQDALMCEAEFDDGVSLFAVFDGHGGCEVSKFAADNLSSYIKASQAYKDNLMRQALISAFLDFDANLKTKESREIMIQILANEDQNQQTEGSGNEEAKDNPRNVNPEHQNEADGSSPGSLQGGKDELAADGESDGGAHGMSAGAQQVAEQLGGPRVAISIFSEWMKTWNKNQKNAGEIGDADDGEAADKQEVHHNEDDDENDEDFVLEEGCEEEDDDDDDNDDDDDCEHLDDEEDEEDDVMVISNVRDPGVDSGTTAVVALISGYQLFVANAGDSRCVLSRNGVAVDMSDDHKPLDDVEKMRIQIAGGEVSSSGRINGNLNLSRALGDHRYKNNEDLQPEEQMITAQPDVKSTMLHRGDEFLVLACDGIWNNMSSQEVVNFVRFRLEMAEKNSDAERPTLAGICEELMDHCLSPDSNGEGCDNMTTILIVFKQLPDIQDGATRQVLKNGAVVTNGRKRDWSPAVPECRDVKKACLENVVDFDAVD